MNRFHSKDTCFLSVFIFAVLTDIFVIQPTFVAVDSMKVSDTFYTYGNKCVSVRIDHIELPQLITDRVVVPIPAIARIIMRLLLSTALFFILAQGRSHINKEWSVCKANQYYNTGTSLCEPCTQCGDHMYEREECTFDENTVCGWCGSSEVVYNADFELKCSRSNYRQLFFVHLRDKLNLQYEITKNALENTETDNVIRKEIAKQMIDYSEIRENHNNDHISESAENEIIHDEISRIKNQQIERRDVEEIIPVNVLERMDGSEEESSKEESLQVSEKMDNYNGDDEVSDDDLLKMVQNLEDEHTEEPLLSADDMIEFKEIDFPKKEKTVVAFGSKTKSVSPWDYEGPIVSASEDEYLNDEEYEVPEDLPLLPLPEQPELLKDELFSSEDMSDEKFESLVAKSAEEISREKWIHIVAITDKQEEGNTRELPFYVENDDKVIQLEKEIVIRKIFNITLACMAVIAFYAGLCLLNHSRKQVRELQYHIERLTLLTPEQKEMIERSAKKIKPSEKDQIHCYENKLAQIV